METGIGLDATLRTLKRNQPVIPFVWKMLRVDDHFAELGVNQSLFEES